MPVDPGALRSTSVNCVVTSTDVRNGAYNASTTSLERRVGRDDAEIETQAAEGRAHRAFLDRRPISSARAHRLT